MQSLCIKDDTLYWEDYTRYKPLSFIKWIGGKSALRKDIATHIPLLGGAGEGIPVIASEAKQSTSSLIPAPSSLKIETYIEPFGGGAWLLFYREKWADAEIYNDLNSDLVNLFRIAKYHPNALIEECECMLDSREEFEFMRDDFRPITDIQRAFRFLYLINHSYSGKQGTFGYNLQKSKPNPSHRIADILPDISKRLSKVTIENLPYEKLIEKYDRPTSFFYCDPPYADYCHSIKKQLYAEIDHTHLCDILKQIKGKFALSYNDHPKIRELYSEYNIIELTRKNYLGNNIHKNNQTTDYHELLIKNY